MLIFNRYKIIINYTYLKEICYDYCFYAAQCGIKNAHNSNDDDRDTPMKSGDSFQSQRRDVQHDRHVQNHLYAERHRRGDPRHATESYFQIL